jgi:dissimilatory sulfite reductase (desulfoviridin) alpha/beta subunit
VSEYFGLKNNQLFVLAEAAGGVYNSDQLRVLCEVADHESAFLKITEDQRIGFMIDPARLTDVQAQVRKSGLLLRSYKAAGVPAPRACLGELCNFAQQPSLGDALELTTHLLKSFPSPKRYSSIGVNGCGRACLGSSTEDVHVVAEETGYKISIGGKGSDIPQQAQLILENITRTDLPVVIEKILSVYYHESQEDERIFDVVERIGLSPFLNALPEHLIPVISDLDPQTASTQAFHTGIEVADELVGSEPHWDESDNQLTESELQLAGELGTTENEDELQLAGELGTIENESAEAFQINSDDFGIEEMNESETALGEPDQIALDSFEGEGSEAIDADAATEIPAQDLLEEAEFEDGTAEDVERVRDAIRTELSMDTNTTVTEKSQPRDILDELDEENNEDEFDSLLTMDTVADKDGPSDRFDESLSQEHADDMMLDVSAEVEHSKPIQTPTGHSVKETGFHSRGRQGFAEASGNVGGRLAINFVGDLLAVELPSGMCFELPFEAVQEGTQLSMNLPDGELRMHREEGVLVVSLGKFHMRFPIPASHHDQVA